MAGADAMIADSERVLEDALRTGRLRNAGGTAIADASRRALLETPGDERREAIVFVGSSVTYGPGLGRDETIPARFADKLRARGSPRPVVNLAQPGGSPHTPIPLAAAFGTRPVRALVVELLVPALAKRDAVTSLPFAIDEIALLEAATPEQKELLRRAGLEPGAPLRLEARLTGWVRRWWRLYRMRGSLWWDSEFTPNYLLWSLRREIATLGFLPRRFHGQTTNVGKLPWRLAYVGGLRPGANQRFAVPTGAIDEKEYGAVRLTKRLADAAGVAVWFFETPLNLPFQREFGLMDEAALERLRGLRDHLLQRLASDGIRVIEAPEMPQDAFLDKAHLTPAGCQRMAQHLDDALRGVVVE